MNEYKASLKYKILPSDALHSYIELQKSYEPGTIIKYGPIPNVLVPEVLHEIQELHVNTLKRLLKGER